jgi:type I restriction enzyme M protein
MASAPTNFTFPSKSTEVLFMQHIGEVLARGGRAAVVVPEGFLFRGGPDQRVRKDLLEHFDVRAVLSLPAGAFLPYTGVKTNVLFIDRRKDERTTEDVWFYELTNDGYELKTTRKPMEGDQLPDFLAKLQERPSKDEEGRCWRVPLAEIAEKGWDLTARNPNREGDYDHRPALELVQSIRTKEERIGALLGELEDLLEGEA